MSSTILKAAAKSDWLAPDNGAVGENGISKERVDRAFADNRAVTSSLERALRRAEEDVTAGGSQVASRKVEDLARGNRPAIAPQCIEVAQAKTGGDARLNIINIDREALTSAGVVVLDPSNKGYHSEQFRQIKRPLIVNAAGRGAAPLRNPNLIMISSSLPGEGKTFVALNLALSIAAEREKTVLLIDADIAKPRIASVLSLGKRKGLTDILSDPKLEVRDVLLKTNIPNFAIIPAGGRDPHATELLASRSMEELCEELASRYADRIVIFDSPPLLLTTEARVLASLTGQICLVVEEGRTSVSDLQRTLTYLKDAELVGFVLNKSHSGGPGGRYYGGYYYYGAHDPR